MTTTDELAFVTAICREPGDDTPRLVFADWLTEHGEEARAEFIRAECEAVSWGCTFAQTREQPGWRHQCGTNAQGYWLCTNPRLRAQGLWDAHAREWFPLLDTFRMGHTSRGFVSELRCTAADWLAHADRIAWHPEQTVACPGCKKCERNPGRIWTGMDGMKWIPCRVARPCPSTAQPITAVTLTTIPDVDGELGDGWYEFNGRGRRHHIGEALTERDAAARLLATEWPGIIFTLPET